MIGVKAVKPASVRPLNRLLNGGRGSAAEQTVSRSPQPTQSPQRRPIGKRRQATCAQCGHVGAVPRDAPGSARIRCTACGTIQLIRQSVGPRPTRFHRRNSAQRARDAAVADVLARYGGAELNDPLADLFQNGGES
jgi:hypothetical protein